MTTFNVYCDESGHLPNDNQPNMVLGIATRRRCSKPTASSSGTMIGAVKFWGRGTNRVLEACARHGIELPTIEEQYGAVYVTFRAQIGPVHEPAGSAA